MTDLMTQLLPLLVDAADVLLVAAITFAAAWLRKRTNIEISARHREALHSAIMSGIRAGVLAHGDRSQAAKDAIVSAAIEHAKASVPDALDHFAPSTNVLRRIGERYLGEALAKVR